MEILFMIDVSIYLYFDFHVQPLQEAVVSV